MLEYNKRGDVFMKKKIIFVVFMVLIVVGLMSCSNSATVTIIDENGEELDVVLSQTDDKEVVKQALIYASQANYEETEGIVVKGNIKGKLLFGEIGLENLDATLEILSNETQMSLDFDFLMALAEKATNGDDGKEEYTLDTNIYSDLSVDNYLYIDNIPRVNGVNMGRTRIYIDMQDLLTQFIPTSPLALQSVANLNLSEELDELFLLVESSLPNSKIEISKVNSKNFVVSMNVSLKDILELSGENNIDGVRGIKIQLDLVFNVKNGFFKELNIKIPNFSYTYNEGNESLKYEGMLDGSLKVSYQKCNPKTLTEEQKELFSPYDSSYIQ